MPEWTRNPDEAISAPENWTPSTGLVTDSWQRIDDGVQTPDDTDHIFALQANARTAYKFSEIGEPADAAEYTRIRIGFRYSGTEITNVPAIRFELWTDYPTPLARKIGEKEINVDTGGAGFIENASVVFDGVSVSPEEFAAIRVIPVTRPDGSGMPGPDPYEVPA